jgi:ubiquinone biosynthesis UbiH/UbiF/VisC/COQ6 family hydroxylase
MIFGISPGGSASPGPVGGDVVVVGRGANGAAAALGLAQAGLRTVLVGPEAAPDPEPAAWDARIFALSPASRALLERLRVWSAIDAGRVQAVDAMRVFPDSRAGAPELRFDARDAGAQALACIVEARNLGAALDRAVGFAGVRVLDARVEEAVVHPDRVELGLHDGSRVRARLLVAADGASSPLRGLLGIAATERAYEQHAVVANFDCSMPHEGCAWQWFGEHGILALLPLPGRRCSMVWSAAPALADELMRLSPAALGQRVSDLAGGVLGSLVALAPAARFPLRLVRADALIAPRALLLGDAAHAMHPLAGQGLNLGFGDVATLLDVVAGREPFRDLGDRLLLRRYERARREPVLAMTWTTDALQRLFDPDPGASLPPLLQPLRTLREAGWRAVAASPWLRQRLVRHAMS